MFDGLAGIDTSRYLLAIGVVGLGLVCLFGVLWVLRNKPSAPFVRGGRARQPRLAVVDATAVDARRRIILVRRDNVEHLIMIGGPTDIVIESRISAEADTKPTVSELPFEPQATLPKVDVALELPAPALSVTEQPVTASVQSQSAPPLKAKLWPTEPKAPAEPLAFQPPAQVRNAAPPPLPTTSPAPTAQSAIPVIATPTPNVSQATPEPEIRNPYLDAETATPAPMRSEPKATPAPAPVSALHKWLRPAEADKQPASKVASSPAPAKPALVSEPIRQTATKPLPNAPVDVDSLISGDFLDAARSRVLDTPSQASVTPEALTAKARADSAPKPNQPIVKSSEFAKILENEIKTGLPESRFDAPRIEPSLVPSPNVSADVRTPFAVFAASPAPSTNAGEGLQAKTVSDILDGARARVLEPTPVKAAAEIAASQAAIAVVSETAKTQPEKPVEFISDAFALEFEKIWEKQAMETAPNVEIGKGAAISGSAPDVSITQSVKQFANDLDIFGMDLELEPSMQPSKHPSDAKTIEDELSLDDEMARVLGEFSITRKN